jgi:FG-GAP-like repeat
MAFRRLVIVLVATAAMVAALVIPAHAARAPQPPSGVQARALSRSEIVVSWNAAAGASGYRVLRGTTSGGPYSAVGTTSALTFTDGGLEAATTYYYVVASTVRNRTSAYSVQASATTAPALAVPSNFKASAGAAGMELTWDPVPGASRYDVINVVLPSDDEVVLGSTTGTSFTHTTAVFGHWYQYKVRAVGQGATADSAVLYVGMGAPTQTTLSVSPNPSEDGQNVVLTATIEAVGQNDLLFTGDSVEFFMDGSSAGRIDLGGTSTPHRAIFQLYGVPVGRHVFYAEYRGEDFTRLGASASASVAQESVPAYGGVSFGPAQVYPYGLDSWLTSAAVADVTGDGLADALMTTGIHGAGVPDADFRLLVLAQQPDHTLAPPRVLPTHASSFRAPMRIATGDLDGDGDTDAAVAGDSGVDVFHQAGGKLGDPTLVATGGLAVDVRIADVDLDGRNDLVVSREDEGGIAVYPGQADGGFGTPTVIGSQGNGQIEVGDVNGDGLPDILTRLTFSFSVYAQMAGGGFAPPVRYDIGAGTGGMAVGDMSGDGRADVAVTIDTNDPDSRILVYRQSDSGGLDDPVVYGVYDIPEPAVLADVDGDGRTDLVTAHGGWWWAGVLLQRPDGLLGREQRARVPAPNASHYDHRGIAVGDLTGDGKPDILLADYIHGIEVLPQS